MSSALFWFCHIQMQCSKPFLCPPRLARLLVSRGCLHVRPVTRILCVGANEAKVDQTTEMYFILCDPFI